jgi:hypothetical protein
MTKITCVSCGTSKNILHKHQLLKLPQCDECHKNTGSIKVSKSYNKCCICTNEVINNNYIRCSTCHGRFCKLCISKNFGHSEFYRIQNLKKAWTCCYLCDNKPLIDLIEKKKWNINLQHTVRKINKFLLIPDISFGREKIEIPCYNEVDKAPYPSEFTYVATPISGTSINLTKDLSSLPCCSCTDNCQDANKCECLKLMNGKAYDRRGHLAYEKEAGIYECNDKCSCNVKRCKNRVVGNGPVVPLEVFRCENPKKGWGLRSTQDLTVGTYVIDYVGEIMKEAECNERGLEYGDEYLFSLDAYGRSIASQELNEMGLRKSRQLFYEQFIWKMKQKYNGLDVDTNDDSTTTNTTTSNTNGLYCIDCNTHMRCHNLKVDYDNTIPEGKDYDYYDIMAPVVRSGFWFPETTIPFNVFEKIINNSELVNKLLTSKSIKLLRGETEVLPGSKAVTGNNLESKKRKRLSDTTPDNNPTTRSSITRANNLPYDLSDCTVKLPNVTRDILNEAKSVITDRALMNVDEQCNSYTVDAK